MHTLRGKYAIVLPLACLSVLTFVHHEFWTWGVGDYYGVSDVRVWRAAGMAVRHGTLRWIYDVGDLSDPATLLRSDFARHDPEAARQLLGWTPGGARTNPWMYLPPAAVLCLPFGLAPLNVERYAFALLNLLLWCWLMYRAGRGGALGWAFVGAGVWVPALHWLLFTGGSTVVLLALVCHGGPLGVALAGWCKPFAWCAGRRK